MIKPIYRRILLKLSGEFFSGDSKHGIDPKTPKGELLDSFTAI